VQASHQCRVDRAA